jgi:hypothetical protein
VAPQVCYVCPVTFCRTCWADYWTLNTIHDSHDARSDTATFSLTSAHIFSGSFTEAWQVGGAKNEFLQRCESYWMKNTVQLCIYVIRNKSCILIITPADMWFDFLHTPCIRQVAVHSRSHCSDQLALRLSTLDLYEFLTTHLDGIGQLHALCTLLPGKHSSYLWNDSRVNPKSRCSYYRWPLPGTEPCCLARLVSIRYWWARST